MAAQHPFWKWTSEKFLEMDAQKILEMDVQKFEATTNKCF